MPAHTRTLARLLVKQKAETNLVQRGKGTETGIPTVSNEGSEDNTSLNKVKIRVNKDKIINNKGGKPRIITRDKQRRCKTDEPEFGGENPRLKRIKAQNHVECVSSCDHTQVQTYIKNAELLYAFFVLTLSVQQLVRPSVTK